MQAGPQLVPCFERGVRERGFDYFRRRLVRVTSGGAAELEAEVRGTENYLVILRRVGDNVESYCGCVYFLDRRLPCKHLWAAVLAGDAAGHLQSLVPPDGVRALDVDSILLEFEEELRLENRKQSAPKLSVPAQSLPAPPRPAPPPVPAWRKALDPLFAPPPPQFESYYAPRNPWPAGAELLYMLNRPGSASSDDLSLALYVREPRKTGGWKKLQILRMRRGQMVDLPLVEDREIVAQLAGTSPVHYSDLHEIPNQVRLAQPLAQTLVPRILATGRCYLFDNVHEITDAPLRWEDGPAWELVAELRERTETQFALTAGLQREGERMELERARHLYASGFLLTDLGLARVAEGTSQRWFHALKHKGEIVIPQEQLPAFVERMMHSSDAPRLELPPSLGFEAITQPPQPQLHIVREARRAHVEWMRADLIFDYAGRQVAEHEQAIGFLDADARKWLRRDLECENEARMRLRSLGLLLIDAQDQRARQWRFAADALPRVAAELLARGWRVTAEGRSLRTALSTRSEVSSAVDWFDLRAEVDYGAGATAQLPELLAALHRGQRVIDLGDGGFGLLPEEWLRQYATIGAMGCAVDGAIRFNSAQAGLLDALLAAQPEIHCDAVVTQIREGLKRFERVEPAAQPDGFNGTLRGYQREGLGWLQFLQRFGFGGCLADDMGVGKTAQVLALLETRRELRKMQQLSKPSIAVVPKSLVFNWRQEAERFTPQLRVVDHTGLDRDVGQIANCDLVLTTYGTLRRDIAELQEIAFDYVILDEAQAVKNAQTDSAKAVRLLRGDHRLAMSGTPVENHIGELWSLFEFLNPGLLGASSLFKAIGTNGRSIDDATLAIIQRGVRPFILRRTKEDVARDLPTKTEQTIYCELEPRERKLYNQLLRHYRDALLPQISRQGVAKTRIQVLEALLRLRQAACHPGLIDAGQRAKSSAKLDLLFEQLEEVLAEGHKALVFSQFTSLLDLVRQRLDAMRIPHEYLHGRTRDRAAPVERFQTMPDVKVFLISLKAGGVGLNLTAADYVFILDPWWNPAAEAQAIDRTHRIGQQRRVFAYRLIARDTVEEKVLELQKTKRALADAILGGSTSLVTGLGREEIELLLS